jgi:toxin ParE1/3/4
MRQVFSRAAEDDLEQIGDYIANDNPPRALQFVQELREHCSRIRAAPLARQARPELGAGMRSVPHGRYVIFFRVERDVILIVRILHGARDLIAEFEGRTD